MLSPEISLITLPVFLWIFPFNSNPEAKGCPPPLNFLAISETLQFLYSSLLKLAFILLLPYSANNNE